MTTADIVLAIILLTTPAGVPEMIPPDDRWDGLQTAVRQQAVQMQILDERETYLLNVQKCFSDDVNELRRRAYTLRNAPNAEEAYRFPPAEFAGEAVAFNRRYRQTLVRRKILELDRHAVINAAIEETDALYDVWYNVNRSQGGSYVVTRREALDALRTLVGEEAFKKGELPPCVPVWQFAEMK